MKTQLNLLLLGSLALTLFTGCIDLSIGTRSSSPPITATIGQQLVDLQKAKASGAISESEYQALRAKVLAAK